MKWNNYPQKKIQDLFELLNLFEGKKREERKKGINLGIYIYIWYYRIEIESFSVDWSHHIIPSHYSNKWIKNKNKTDPSIHPSIYTYIRTYRIAAIPIPILILILNNTDNDSSHLVNKSWLMPLIPETSSKPPLATAQAKVSPWVVATDSVGAGGVVLLLWMMFLVLLVVMVLAAGWLLCCYCRCC